jgi:hypothetical protein
MDGRDTGHRGEFAVWTFIGAFVPAWLTVIRILLIARGPFHLASARAHFR